MIINILAILLYCIVLPIYIVLYYIVAIFKTGNISFLSFTEDSILNPLFIIGIIELIVIGNYVRFIVSKLLCYLCNRCK